MHQLTNIYKRGETIPIYCVLLFCVQANPFWLKHIAHSGETNQIRQTVWHPREHEHNYTKTRYDPEKNAWLCYSGLCVLHNKYDDFDSLLVKSCLCIFTWHTEGRDWICFVIFPPSWPHGYIHLPWNDFSGSACPAFSHLICPQPWHLKVFSLKLFLRKLQSTNVC